MRLREQEIQDYLDRCRDDVTLAGAAMIADALHEVSDSLDRLGNADAATPLGGMEALGMALKDGLASLGVMLHDGLTDIASSLPSKD
jgi:hypothetical protein